MDIGKLLGSSSFKGQSAIEYITTYGWAIVILTIVLAALFNLGLFNPGSLVSTSCIFPAQFGCLNAVLYSVNGTLAINLQQASTASINVTAIGCNNRGLVANMIIPNNPPSDQITIAIGGNSTFYVQCYQNSSKLVVNPGQLFKGYILINYTNLQTGFPHTAQGTIVAKAI